jgi:hypothetical protein
MSLVALRTAVESKQYADAAVAREQSRERGCRAKRRRWMRGGKYSVGSYMSSF